MNVPQSTLHYQVDTLSLSLLTVIQEGSKQIMTLRVRPRPSQVLTRRLCGPVGKYICVFVSPVVYPRQVAGDEAWRLDANVSL